MKNIDKLLEMDCLKTGEVFIKSCILVQKNLTSFFMGILLWVLCTSILLWKVSFPFLSIIQKSAALRAAQTGRHPFQGHHNTL